MVGEGLRIHPLPGMGLSVEGELDLASVEGLNSALGDLLSTDGPLLVDLTALSFMDSSGIHALLQAAHELESSGGCLFLHVAAGQVSRIVRLTELDTSPNVHVAEHGSAANSSMDW